MLGHRTMNVEDYLVIFKRRWWIVVVPAVVLTIVAFAITFVIPPVYESQTLVLIDQQKVPDQFVKPIVNEDLSSRIASMNEQIMSRSTIQPLVEKYNLYGDQRLDLDLRIDKVRKDILLEAISGGISRSNNLPGFKIHFRASDPHTAQLVCSDITSLFTGVNLRSREAAAEGTTSFIKEQLDQAKQNLDDQDAKLAAFQRQYFGMLPDDEKNNVDLLSSLGGQLDSTSGQLQTLEQSQSMMEAMLAQQSAPTATAAGPTSQTPQAEQAELDRLIYQRDDLTPHYMPDYPEVRTINRKIADLQAQMAKEEQAPPPAVAPAAPPVNRPDSSSVQQLRSSLAGVRLAITAKRKQQEQIEQQMRLYQGRLQSSPQVAEQQKELTRNYQTAQAQYDALYNEMHDAQMATDLEHRQEGEQFTVLDPANLPDAPIFPKLIVFVSGGFAGGLVLGLVIVALIEYRDTALRSERDVWAFTQLPTLAVIAWSAGMDDAQPGRLTRLKRLFSRKTPKQLASDAPG